MLPFINMLVFNVECAYGELTHIDTLIHVFRI